MKIDHSALPQPERSPLRKMSLKIMISIQIQMKNRKNQSIDQKTCPVPNSANNMTVISFVLGCRASHDSPSTLHCRTRSARDDVAPRMPTRAPPPRG